ncbi:hypothetical protein LCGC14_1449440 [marine sediment metagenome]|uniref:Uncharacterized protein n=1 Tax=marine sediment metagenome TaxID=412755 RepID=A0A0F9LYU0_9ZZZZ
MKKDVIFKINEHITVKLEEGITRIYNDGESFIQCKSLLLNIPEKSLYKYNKISSIDDIVYISQENYNLKKIDCSEEDRIFNLETII